MCYTKGDKVFITSEEGAQKIESGEKDIMPIGSDATDVFEIPENQADIGNWPKMTKWRPEVVGFVMYIIPI